MSIQSAYFQTVDVDVLVTIMRKYGNTLVNRRYNNNPYNIFVTTPIVSSVLSPVYSPNSLASIVISYHDQLCILSKNALSRGSNVTYSTVSTMTNSEGTQLSFTPNPTTYAELDHHVSKIVFDLRRMGVDVTTQDLHALLRQVKFPFEGYQVPPSESDGSYDAEYQQRQQDAILRELSQVERVLNDDIDNMVDNMFNDDDNGDDLVGNAPIAPPRIVPQVVYRTIQQVAPQPVSQPAPKRYTQHIGLSTLVDMYEAMKERLEGLEDCPICAIPITTENASMTVCTHIFCNTCISKIDKCSICRESLLLK